jgi:hypothetical protein
LKILPCLNPVSSNRRALPRKAFGSQLNQSGPNPSDFPLDSQFPAETSIRGFPANHVPPAMPSTFEFCLPTSATTVPDHPVWLHEVKYDGYRLLPFWLARIPAAPHRGDCPVMSFN